MSPLIALLFLLSSAFFSAQACPPLEMRALLRFKSSLNLSSFDRLASWKGGDCCVWSGVECNGSKEERHVSKLNLSVFGLRSISGEIDSSLSELTHLTYLDLSGNGFYGEIPSQLAKLSFLRHLDLTSYRAFIYEFSNEFLRLTSCNLHWLSNLSSLEYLSLYRGNVTDRSWASIIASLFHLKHLDLSSCSQPGPTIPSALLNLSSLAYLGLRGNSFSYIPAWMGKLSTLTHLDLSWNNISGSIPNTIENLTGLEYLDLSFNVLTGQIPSRLELLTNLTNLDLSGNQLKGNIPSSLGNLHKLKYLYLDSNHLSGYFPPSLFHLSSLTGLYVSDNRLNGSIPSGLMLPSSLQDLYLSNNNMNGTITEVFFQKSLKLAIVDLSNSGLRINFSSASWIPSFQLEYLNLRKCQIGGPIPSWISTQFNLQILDLSVNQLMRNLPSWLWDIEEVHLSDNHLQGSFTPTSGLLRYLDLSMNQLSGGLPADIHVNLSNAQVLILADNNFVGKIPTSIVNLTKLFSLDMSYNSLTGNVPATLGNLTNLEDLNLESNHLEGKIPKELGSLSNLQFLRIGKNSLEGVLPSSLRKISGLQVLDVGGNNLLGNIPYWIANFSSLHVLLMRSNKFRGILLPDVGRMPELQVLDLSSNLFSGVIPSSYLGLPAMQNSYADGHVLSSAREGVPYSIDLIVKGQELHYEHILSSFTCFDLSNNRLTGHLLPEIQNLRGLMHLNLSKNSLRGPIPESLGILVQLESVDLSFNKFSGRIPLQIGNLTYLAHLNLSYNNLSGRIPQEGPQMLTFDESSYIGNPNLWGCPLEKNCSRPVARAAPPAVGVKKRGESFEFPWYWMCFGLSWGVGFGGVVMVLLWKLSWRVKCFAMMDTVISILPKPKPVWG